MTLLITPANAHASAAGQAQRFAKDESLCVLGQVVRSKIKPAVAARASNHGKTVGDGPEANGFSQGSATSSATNTSRIMVAIAASLAHG
jgi:hypothetical protein